MVTKNQIQKAREVNMQDILDSLEIPYKSVGSNIKTNCPFHEEFNDSLVFYDHACHCFGCGIHYGTIDFIMNLLKADFESAVRLLNQI